MKGFELAGENAEFLLVHTRVELGEGLCRCFCRRAFILIKEFLRGIKIIPNSRVGLLCPCTGNPPGPRSE